MNLFAQTLLAFGVTLLVLGYFQYRRKADVVSIVQEMFRPQYLLPAAAVALGYLVLKVVFSLLGKVL